MDGEDNCETEQFCLHPVSEFSCKCARASIVMLRDMTMLALTVWQGVRACQRSSSQSGEVNFALARGPGHGDAAASHKAVLCTSCCRYHRLASRSQVSCLPQLTKLPLMLLCYYPLCSHSLKAPGHPSSNEQLQHAMVTDHLLVHSTLRGLQHSMKHLHTATAMPHSINRCERNFCKCASRATSDLSKA